MNSNGSTCLFAAARFFLGFAGLRFASLAVDASVPSFHAHHESVRGFTPSFSANSVQDNPLAFHAFACFVQNSRPRRFADPTSRFYAAMPARALRGSSNGYGATTHAFDMNQRYVPVDFTVLSESELSVSVEWIESPGNEFALVPGWYMLFLISEDGVPSVAPYVQVVQ